MAKVRPELASRVKDRCFTALLSDPWEGKYTRVLAWCIDRQTFSWAGLMPGKVSSRRRTWSEHWLAVLLWFCVAPKYVMAWRELEKMRRESALS